MSIKKLGKNKSMRVQTASGLDMRLYNDSLEVELERMPFGVNMELVDSSKGRGALAPPGAYYVITFYKPDTTTGASGRVNEVKSVLPGAVYLSREGVLIRGCTPIPSRVKEASIGYKDRF